MCKLCHLCYHVDVKDLLFQQDLSLNELFKVARSCRGLEQKMARRLEPLSMLVDEIKGAIAPYEYNLFRQLSMWTFQDYEDGALRDYLEWWIGDGV